VGAMSKKRRYILLTTIVIGASFVSLIIAYFNGIEQFPDKIEIRNGRLTFYYIHPYPN
jgi:hypothetical protein